MPSRGKATINEKHQKPGPQSITTIFKNIIILGRIQFCLEGPAWTLFGSLLHAKYLPPSIFHLPPSGTGTGSGTATSFSVSTLIPSLLVIFITGISINYANEYFDFEADMLVTKITPDLIGGSGILVRGYLPRWVALVAAIVVQGFALGVVYEAEAIRGSVLWFGLGSMVVAHQYVGPPLRLHYRGLGELSSSFLLCGGPILFGYLSQYSAIHKASPSSSASVPLTSLGQVPSIVPREVGVLICISQIFEFTRVMVMHCGDIKQDSLANKWTLVAILGLQTSANLFVGLWAVIIGGSVVAAYTYRGIAVYLVLFLGYAVPVAIRLGSGLYHMERGGVLPKLASLATLATPLLWSLVLLCGY